MEKVAGGDLEHSVPINSTDEMGVLAKAFNSMIKDLKGQDWGMELKFGNYR